MKQTIAQFLNVKDFPFIIKNTAGNVIYYEDSKGYWFKNKHDKNGNRICCEDSDGCYVKSKYDENNNMIYYEDTDDVWVKREYDKNGNEIYYEDSDGRIINNKPKNSCNNKIVEIDGKKYKLKEIK